MATDTACVHTGGLPFSYKLEKSMSATYCPKAHEEE